tara:strand:+ start:557 stop:997 length:441 start_codon:yes stop_codon:yes gene_type:complete
VFVFEGITELAGPEPLGEDATDEEPGPTGVDGAAGKLPEYDVGTFRVGRALEATGASLEDRGVPCVFVKEPEAEGDGDGGTMLTELSTEEPGMMLTEIMTEPESVGETVDEPGTCETEMMLDSTGTFGGAGAVGRAELAAGVEEPP